MHEVLLGRGERPYRMTLQGKVAHGLCTHNHQPTLLHHKQTEDVECVDLRYRPRHLWHETSEVHDGIGLSETTSFAVASPHL